ncbi:MAG: DUF7315 family membrane protein [Halobacteriota archaeon]
MDSDSGTDVPEQPQEPVGRSGRRERRDVVVPMRIYKTVIVFSTLIAVVCVVFGFMLLDAATLGVSAFRDVLTFLLAVIGVVPPADVLSAVLAAFGLVSIGFGAVVYIIGSRFRARGMGKSQEDSHEDSDNG